MRTKLTKTIANKIVENIIDDEYKEQLEKAVLSFKNEMEKVAVKQEKSYGFTKKQLDLSVIRKSKCVRLVMEKEFFDAIDSFFNHRLLKKVSSYSYRREIIVYFDKSYVNNGDLCVKKPTKTMLKKIYAIFEIIKSIYILETQLQEIVKAGRSFSAIAKQSPELIDYISTFSFYKELEEQDALKVIKKVSLKFKAKNKSKK